MKPIHTFMEAPGKYLGNCAGDMCDLERVAEENVKFAEAGQYQIIVTHNVKADKIAKVMEVGLVLNAI